VKIHRGRQLESLYTISTRDLWEKAKQQKIHFYQYYKWIDQELNKAYVHHLYLSQMTGCSDEELLDSFLPANSSISHNDIHAQTHTQTQMDEMEGRQVQETKRESENRKVGRREGESSGGEGEEQEEKVNATNVSTNHHARTAMIHR